MITNVEISMVEGKKEKIPIVAIGGFNVNFEDVKMENGNIIVAFDHSALYFGKNNEQAGKIAIKGTVTTKEDEKRSKEIMEKWTKEKSLPLDYAEELVNFITFDCGARGTLISYAVGLAPPIPIKASLQEKK
ncbi:MAG: hypothetical protein QXL16_01205 [Candidatus Micrarchaeaceae archaeon]